MKKVSNDGHWFEPHAWIIGTAIIVIVVSVFLFSRFGIFSKMLSIVRNISCAFRF